LDKTETKHSLHCPNCGASAAQDAVRCDYCRAVLSLTSCPSCFGAVFKGMKYCPNCGSAVEREALETDRKLKCPRCQNSLAPLMLADTKVRECSVCGGIWLDTATFQKVCDERERQEKILVYPVTAIATDALPEQKQGRMYVPCPECGGLMQRRNFVGISGIIVDWCKDHGTWFDYRELQGIINFIRNGGLQKARTIELTKLQEERHRLEGLQLDQDIGGMNDLEPISDDLPSGSNLLDMLISIVSKLFRA
jgi:Zn-finger nucleic acid-binding protein